MAVRKGRVGLIELMLQYGADVRWLDFGDLLDRPNPHVLKLFIEGGVDTQTGYPIAGALKRAPRAFLGIYKTYVDRNPNWKFQADIALRYFCEKGSMHGVCLLLWLGADPRAKVPLKYGEDEELWVSGVWQACICGHADIVKKIGVNRAEDDLDELLCLAGHGVSAELMRYLVGAGANPNANPKEGERALRAALWSLEWRIDFDRHGSDCGRYRDALEALRVLVELGARLDPGSKEAFRFLRQCFMKLRPHEAFDLLTALVNHNFADRKVFLTLLKTPKVVPQFDWYKRKLFKLFPELKPKERV